MRIEMLLVWVILSTGSYRLVSVSPGENPLPLTTSALHLQVDAIQWKIIKGADNSYGYDISKNGRMVIHQPVIPCIKGTRGFKRKSDAEKLAAFVADKIRKGESLPSVTVEEMQQLGVLF